MESPFANLFLAIQDRLLEKVPEIKYIDQNLGQYMNPDFRNQMLFPCALIDFPVTPFSALQGDIQFGEPTIVVTLFNDIWNNTSSITPLGIKEAGLKYLETEQKVFMALQGWSPEEFSQLTRTQQKSHNSNEIGLIVKEMTFTSSFEDYSCDDTTPTYKISLSSEQG